jgi:Ca2+-binding RTX toxin-like protein
MHMSRRGRIHRTVIGPLAVGAALIAVVALTAAPAQAAPSGVSVKLNGSLLTITGDSVANSLTVGNTAAGVITLNGAEVLDGAGTTANVLDIVMDGGAGNDTLRVGETHSAMPGLDFRGGEGNDQLFGGSGSDNLLGGTGGDTLVGNGGVDNLVGDSGNDTATGGPGNDTVSLGADSDQFTWNTGDGNDRVDGDTGTDTLLFNNGDGPLGGLAVVTGVAPRVSISADFGGAGDFHLDVSGFEQMKMNNGNEVRVGDLSGTGVSVLRINFDPHTDGGFDEASVNGTSAADRIRIAGSPTTGVTVFGVPTTVLITGAESLTVIGRDGDDIIDATGLSAGIVNLTEFGDLGAGPVAGNDTLIGTPGHDQLIGGDGTDRFEERGGNDFNDAVPGEVVIL